MPVPHNWYATNRRISSPTVMRTRPTAPITVRTGREATSGLLPRLVPRERFAQVRGRFVHSSCLEAATRGEARGGVLSSTPIDGHNGPGRGRSMPNPLTGAFNRYKYAKLAELLRYVGSLSDE